MSILKLSDLMIVFDATQKNAGEAAISVDNGCNTGTIDIMGHIYAIRFWADSCRKLDDDRVNEQINNAKKILNSYNIDYKLVVLRK